MLQGRFGNSLPYFFEGIRNIYHFKVENQLKGDDHIRELQVEKYRPWFCDPKRDDYEVGKAFLLFLNKHTEQGWHTISGSTGEARVLKGDSIQWNNPATNYPINQVFEGIEMVLKCYQQSGEKCYYPICDVALLDSLSQKNAFIKIIQFHQSYANEYFMIKETEMEERHREYLESIKKN